MGGMIEAGTESIVSELTYEYLNYYDFPCIVFHTPYKKDADKNWWVNYRYSVIKDLRALGNKMLLCIENVFPRGYYMPFAKPEDMLDFLNESNLYANIDTTHYAHDGIDIVNAAEVLRRRVKTIHISDYSDNKQHLFIGDGSLDFVSFFNKLDLNGLHSVTIECKIGRAHV
jgi:sugar phosphate isomerase/epimerase